MWMSLSNHCWQVNTWKFIGRSKAVQSWKVFRLQVFWWRLLLHEPSKATVNRKTFHRSQMTSSQNRGFLSPWSLSVIAPPSPPPFSAVKFDKLIVWQRQHSINDNVKLLSEGSPWSSSKCKPVHQSSGSHFPPLTAKSEPELTMTILLPSAYFWCVSNFIAYLFKMHVNWISLNPTLLLFKLSH